MCSGTKSKDEFWKQWLLAENWTKQVVKKHTKEQIETHLQHLPMIEAKVVNILDCLCHIHWRLGGESTCGTNRDMLRKGGVMRAGVVQVL